MNKTPNPYQVIKHRHVTEKATTLESLHENESNPSVRRCDQPKVVFKVDSKATKPQIAAALEEIYREKGIRVVSVNTITIKPKRRRVRGRPGMKAGYKKAVVTLQKGDKIDNT